MAFNLNEFRNKLVNGGARPNQFEMQITWPDQIRGVAGVSSAERDFRFFCSIAHIPKDEMGLASVKYFGRTLKYAGDRTFADLPVTVINDEDYKIHKALEAWMNAISGHSVTTSQFAGANAGGSYATDGIVYQLSRNNGGSVLAAYKFIGMFPSSIDEIALDWSTENAIEQYRVTFAYQWWEAVDPNSGVPLGQQ
jgi:hypothetical protein